MIEVLSDLPEANRPSEEERAKGMRVKNARHCGVCGAGADLYGWGYQCQANSNHMGDPTVGLFDDFSYPTS